MKILRNLFLTAMLLLAGIVDTLDIENMIELKLIRDPDLSRVSEVGFTDLMRGGGSAACSRLDWIEVYAYIVDGY